MNNLCKCLNNKNKPNCKSKCMQSKKHHLSFKQCKCNTINSLNEVECFLDNFHNCWKSIKLYKILKK